jgi:hypothetical protein
MSNCVVGSGGCVGIWWSTILGLVLIAWAGRTARSDEKKCKTISLRFSAPVKAWSTLGLPVDGARRHLTYQEPAAR